MKDVTFRLEDGFNPTSRCTPPLTNRDVLEMFATSQHAYTETPGVKGSKPENMFVSWIRGYTSLNYTTDADTRRLQDRARRLEQSAMKKVDAYNRSRNKKTSVAQPLLDNLLQFLDSKFVWAGQQDPKTKQISLKVSGSAVHTNNQSAAVLLPRYEAVDHSFGPPLCPPSPPPSYEEAMATGLSPNIDGQLYMYSKLNHAKAGDAVAGSQAAGNSEKRMHLRNGTSYNSSPGKVELKEHLRKVSSSLTRCKRKLEDEQNNKRKLQKTVGVRQRDLHAELEKTNAALIREQLSARKNKDKVERLKAEEIKSLREKLTKDMEKMEEEKMAWKEYATDLIDRSEEVDKAQSHIGHLKKTNYNLCRKLFRRDEAIPKLEERLHLAQQKVKEAEALMEDKANQHRVDSAAYEGIVAELEAQLTENNNKIEEMESQMKSLKSLESKSGGVYTTEVRLTYYHLLQMGVSANKVESIVRSVLQNLTSIDIKNTPLPKRSLAQRMKLEAGCLAEVRGMVEWSRRDDKRVGYHSDKSPKAQLEWLTHKFVLAPTPEEAAEGKRTTFTLSLAPVTGGSAQHSLDDLIHHIERVRDMAKEYGIEDADNIYNLRNIASKMSDRAATEMKHTTLLENAKEKELMQTEGWEEKTEAEREELTRVIAVTCSMHKLHNVAESMTKACSNFLYKDTMQSTTSRQMVGAKKHVYETDKLLCTESKKEIAEGKEFKAYCLANEVTDVAGCELFKPIVGSRYFIFLLNSIPTYCGQEFIKTFLLDQKDMKGKWNKLEKSVFDGFSCEKTLAEERAYGILFYEVFQPLYAKCKMARSPLDLNELYSHTLTKFHLWGNNPQPLFKGDDSLYEDFRETKYASYIGIIREEHPTDGLVTQLLGIACKAAHDKLQSHASEHLPNGKYFNPSGTVLSAAALVDGSTNDTCESDFGVLDRVYNSAPNSNPLSVSAMARAKRDHATEWATAQPKEVQMKAVHFARRHATRLHVTKDMQLKGQFAAKEPLRREKIEKRRRNRSKKAAAEESRLTALQEGKLVLDKRTVSTLKSADVATQTSLWVLLDTKMDVSRRELLHGRSKLTLPQKKKMLTKLIGANKDIIQRWKRDNPNVFEQEEIDDVALTSDEEDAAHGDDNPGNCSSSEDELPLRALAQLGRKGNNNTGNCSSSEDELPLRDLARLGRKGNNNTGNCSSSEDELPLRALARLGKK